MSETYNSINIGYKDILLAIIVMIVSSASIACQDYIPNSNKNNAWYCFTKSDTVIVFVHGLLSNSRSAWLYENKSGKDTYWPSLVYNDDEIFQSPSIFLGGFYTGINSGTYRIRDAANELNIALGLKKSPANKSVWDYKKIIFVAHSTGGIVVRHILTKYSSKLKDKYLGLVLMASPSMGSKDAERFEWIAELGKHAMIKELAWDNIFLKDLDRDFANLTNRGSENYMSNLVGIEAIENHFIFGGYLKNRKLVVDEESGGRYFGEPIRIGGSDHYSIVKPKDTSSQSHALLQYFYQKIFQNLIIQGKRSTGVTQHSLNGNEKSKITFKTPHIVLEQRAQVEIKKDNALFKVVSFHAKSDVPTGNYSSSALIDNREVMHRNFSIDDSFMDQIIHFDDDPILIGNIVDSGGNPLGNIHVNIDNTQVTSTDDGHYIIDDIELKRSYDVKAYNDDSGKFTLYNPWTGTIHNTKWATELQYNIVLRRNN